MASNDQAAVADPVAPEAPDTSHDWKPDHEANQSAIYLDTETGKVYRFKALTDPSNVSFVERCADCGTKRRRTFELGPGPAHEAVETTPPDSPCKA